MKKKNRVFAFTLVILFISIAVSLYINSSKMLVKIGKSYYESIMSTASYYAVEKVISSGEDYGNLFEVTKNSSGDIVMLNTYTYKFNVLSQKIAFSVGEFFEHELSSGIDVPIGAFTGLNLFYGFGKKIKMNLITVSSVKCDILSEFESGGINQTRHTLQILITPDVSIVTKFKTEKITDSISILVYDNLIVGKVPEIYLAGKIYSGEYCV